MSQAARGVFVDGAWRKGDLCLGLKEEGRLVGLRAGGVKELCYRAHRISKRLHARLGEIAALSGTLRDCQGEEGREQSGCKGGAAPLRAGTVVHRGAAACSLEAGCRTLACAGFARFCCASQQGLACFRLPEVEAVELRAGVRWKATARLL